ncbi:uncharacterized protein M6B38_333050 [Iris pallida]|uniref:Core-2/I-branching beta-1,6-N-acetylglucosaminyltransferase family protein n=1 Tax=Iris pallida TaxID=29817 RepID=A0AAX6H2F1_IRIPA|nr:uncharacterized protein M6B38_333050 [Iris pallida]
MYSSSPFIFSLLLLLSIPAIFYVAPRILPPKTLPAIPDLDEADDLALFRRATLSSSSSLRLPPPPSPPKIAFLFLTNSDLSFAPLWELFFRGHHRSFNLYIHLDPNSKLNYSLLTPSFVGRFIPAKATQRGSPTLISAARRLLAAALLDDPSNAFFALISQHCVPLHSFRIAYRTLFSSPRLPSHRRKSFIEIVAHEPNLMNRYVARGDGFMLPEIPFEDFRVGSQFFVLARRHAVAVVRDRRLWKKFRVPCLKAREDSCYPEEHYFPTLLSMQDSEGCTHYTLTRVNWTGSVGGHPHLYGPGEVTADLVRELRRSNSTYSYLFARKFAPACLEPLMRIAESVILCD